MGPRIWLKVLIAVFPVWALAEQNSETLKPSMEVKKPEQYTVPLRFTPEDLDMKVKSYELKWDLTREDSLQMGPVSIDSSTFVLAFFKNDDTSNPLKKDTLLVAWPTSLFPEGRLELITRYGAVVWSEEFSSHRVREWKKTAVQLSADSEVGKVFQNSILGFHSLSSDILAQQNGPFRFCLSKTVGSERTMLCSVRYIVDRSGPALALAQIKEKKEPRVLIEGEAVKKTGSVPVQVGQTVSFFAETSTGAAYEFISKVPAPEVIDIVKGEDDQVLYRGFSPFPVGAERELHSNEQDTFWNKIGWQQTIGDLRSRWTYKAKAGAPLAFSGRAGGVFILYYESKFLPEETDRLWLSSEDVPLTYSAQSTLSLFKGAKMKLQAQPPSDLKWDNETPQEIKWNFYAPEVEAYNRSILNVENGTNAYKTSLEIYRGYSSELSGRLTVASDNRGESLMLGEVSYNQWFQSLLGWENRQWSVLRWGVSAKYFKSLTQFSSASTNSLGISKSDISFANLSAKYRFSPGLWGRHETWGAMLDYQNVDSTVLKGAVLGGGLFWGRSMPRIFDEWMNVFSFLRYPKFVDMELLYYPVALSPNTDVSGTYSASFHGKIFWTKRFFGEAGFAFKSFTLEDKDVQYSYIRYSLNLFSVTAGLGVNF